MNIFGIILSFMLVLFLAYLAFYIFFETKINDYVRIGFTLSILGSLIYFMIFHMSKFWE